MLSSVRRRALGAFYTPADVVDRLVSIALEGLDGVPVVCDPACGDGAFLLGVGRALESRGVSRRTIAEELLWGIDIDPVAVGAAREAIVAWSGADPGDHLRVDDALCFDGWCDRFDLVIGNPPFLNQLERATARAVAPRWNVGPYADTAWVFLLVALELARERGRVLLLQPQSVAAARDAAAIRAAVAERATLTGMWTGAPGTFPDANVEVCAPLVRLGHSRGAVRRWAGDNGAARASVARDEAAGATWGPFLVRDDAAPPVAIDSDRCLGALVTATAGFRDQFYGLAPHVVERAGGAWPQLVTSGMVDPLQCAWGERPARFAGRRWVTPRVDVDALPAGALQRWVRERLVPKVVLATQTKVLEPAIDAEGAWIPSTPVIAVHAAPDALGHVAAVLLAPPVSAWASAQFAGTALSARAIKLSAKQVLTIPLPRDQWAWDAAAVAARRGDLVRAARAMTDAYGADAAVYDWWARRALNG